jgi:hypothetical protein
MWSASSLSRLTLPDVLHEARREAHNKSVSHPGTRDQIESLCRLAERTCRFAIHAKLCAMRDAAPEPDAVARINTLAFLAPLARPSFGHLVSILLEIGPALDATQGPIHPHVRLALAPECALAGPLIIEAARALQTWTRQRITTVGELLNGLVALRNTGQHAHERQLTDAEAARLGPLLQAGLVELLGATPLLAEWRLLFINEVVMARGGLSLRGVQGDRLACPPLWLRTRVSRPPEATHLHLVHLDAAGDGVDALIDLFPLVDFDPADDRHPFRVFCGGVRGRPRFEGGDERRHGQTEAMERFTVMLGPPRAALEDHYRRLAAVVDRLGDPAERDFLESGRRLLGLSPDRAAALEREAASTASTALAASSPPPTTAHAPLTTPRLTPEGFAHVTPGVARLDPDCTVAVTRPLLTAATVETAPAASSWLEAVRSCNARSAADGLPAAYDLPETAAPRDDLRFHAVRRSLAPILGDGLLAELEARFFLEPGRGGKRRERKVPEAVIARELVGALRESPEALIGVEAASLLRRVWQADEFLTVTVTWSRGVAGWRLPTEAEWRRLAEVLPVAGPEWVWDLDPDTRERNGVHPGAPPRGAHVDWCGEVGGPRRLWLAVEGGEVARRCALPWDRTKGVRPRFVRDL